MLLKLGRHNMRPNHLHLMVEAPGFRKLVTALYPAGDEFLASDAVFGVKKGLVVVRHFMLSYMSCPRCSLIHQLRGLETGRRRGRRRGGDLHLKDIYNCVPGSGSS